MPFSVDDLFVLENPTIGWHHGQRFVRYESHLPEWNDSDGLPVEIVATLNQDSAPLRHFAVARVQGVVSHNFSSDRHQALLVDAKNGAISEVSRLYPVDTVEPSIMATGVVLGISMREHSRYILLDVRSPDSQVVRPIGVYCTLPLEKVVDGIVVGDVIQASLRFLAVQKLSEDGLSVLAFKATVLVRLSVHGIISEASPQASQTDSPQNEAKSYCGISGLGFRPSRTFIGKLMLFGGIAVAAALCHRFRQPSAVFEDLMNVKGQKINRAWRVIEMLRG